MLKVLMVILLADAPLHAGLLELPDDPLHGTLRDADLARDLAHALLGVAHDADEHVRVVTEDRPLRPPGRRLVLCGFSHMGRHDTVISRLLVQEY